jgi:hypothetical protein
VHYRQGGGQGGVDAHAHCRGEVLLCAGAIQSPQLLQLSGIGPAALLQQHGMPVQHELPGVGENLQDHLQIRLILECRTPITTNDDLNSWSARRSSACSGCCTAAGRWPWASTRAAASCARCRTRPPHPTSSSTSPRCRPTWPAARCTRFPASRCRVPAAARIARHIRIRSADPFEPPEMQPNYLATELDRRTAVAGVKAARAIAAAPAMAPFIKREVKPGPEADRRCRAARVLPQQRRHDLPPHRHLPMGPDPAAGAVVDARLRVHGVAWPARDRLLGDADPGVGQHQRGRRDDGREGRRPDPRGRRGRAAFEILDAVDKGIVEGGYAWTHYWSARTPAAGLFSNPMAGAGVGLDQLSHVAWLFEGGGYDLYRKLYSDIAQGQRRAADGPADGPRSARLVQDADQLDSPTSRR